MTKKQTMGFEVHLNQPYASAVDSVVAALKAQGFGVLTRIDIQATFKEKLNTDFRPYVILGACNPALSHRALSTDSVVGLLLPCNVTVEEDLEGGSLVRIVNPEAMLLTGSLKEQPEIHEVARLAKAHLEKVAESLLES